MSRHAQRDVEFAVLSGLIRSQDNREEIMPLLSVHDFTTHAHQSIFDAVLDLDRASAFVDSRAIAEWLQRRGLLLDVGFHLLGEIAAADPTGGECPYFASVLRDRTLLRGIGHLGEEMRQEAVNPNGSPSELLSRFEGELFSLAQNRSAKIDTVTVADVLPSVMERIDSYQVGNEKAGLPTGLVGLDDLLVGFPDGSMITVGARPSNGKTALGLQFARHTSLVLGHAVFFVSMEQSREEIVERMLSGVSLVDGRTMRTRDSLSRTHAQAIQAARDRLADAKIIIDDAPNQSMFRIMSNARRLKRRNDIRLVVIDYLQLIQPEDRKQNRVEQVAQISRRVKQLARELDVPVIVLAQLNREVEGRADTRPKLSDLKESGAIEQDSDIVILIHRVVKESGERTDLLVAKQRNGPIGDVRVVFDKARMLFSDVAIDAFS